MALGSCVYLSPCINTPADPTEELNELTSQSLARRSNVGSDEAPTKALTLPETPTLPLVPPLAKDLFTKFMKVFMKTTQAQTLAEPQERPLKAKTPETY